MKKIFKNIISLFVCITCLFVVVGCTPNYSDTTTDTSKVVANGGSSVVYDGYLYFANGMATNDGENNGGTIGSIYKVAISDDGEIADDAQYEKVVDCLVGYNKGSITIIGNFLYYTTPNTGKNKSGKTLYDKTVFMRKDLKTNETQEIYKTEQNSADEAVEFAYYTTGENRQDLHLVVYEATSQTLKSFKIGNKIKTAFSKENVTDVALSETMGSDEDNAENFVFYTMSAKENAIDTSTNRLFKICPDGSQDTLINDNKTLSIEGIKAGKLIITASFGTSPTSKNTYAFPITKETQKGDITIAKDANSNEAHESSDRYVICRNEYSTLMFIEEDNGDIAILYLNGKKLTYEKYSGNTSSEISYIIHEFESTPTMTFIGSFTSQKDNQSYAVFVNKDSSKNKVYKVRYSFESNDDCLANRKEPEELTTTDIKVESTSSSSSSDTFELGNMLPKIIGKYVYVYANDEDGNILLYRVSLYTPKELNEMNPPAEGEEPDEDDLKVSEATLVGGRDI